MISHRDNRDPEAIGCYVQAMRAANPHMKPSAILDFARDEGIDIESTGNHYRQAVAPATVSNGSHPTSR